MKLFHLASHLHFTVPMATAFHPHIHSGPNPWSALPTVNQHSILRTRPFPHMVISFPVTLFPSQNAESVNYATSCFNRKNKGTCQPDTNQASRKLSSLSVQCSPLSNVTLATKMSRQIEIRREWTLIMITIMRIENP